MNDDSLTTASPETYRDDQAGDQGEASFYGPAVSSGTAMASAAAMLATAAVTFVLYKPAFHAACVCTLGVALFVFSLRRSLRRDMGLRAILMSFFMPSLAWMLPSPWLVYLVMLAWVPVFSGRLERVAGIYLFSLMLLPGLDQPIELGGLKLFDFGIHDALALGAAAAIFKDARKSRVASGDDARVGLLLLVLVFAMARDSTFTHFMRTTTNVILDFGLPYYILSRGLAGVEAMRSAMRWLAASGAGLAGVLAYEVWHWWPMYNELYWRQSVPMVLIVKTRGAMLRAGGPFNEPTSIALVMAMCLFALWLLRQDFRTKALHMLLCVVTFVGLSAPQSRNAWIGLGLAILLADVFTGRWVALVRKIVPAAAAIGLIVVVASTSPEWSESLGLSGQGSDTADYRRALLERGTEEFWKSPVLGYPARELEQRLNDMRQGEGIIDYVNTYLWFGLFAGIGGVVVFVANMFGPLVQLWRRRSVLDSIDALAPGAFVFGCMAMLATTLFFTSFGGRIAFLTFGYIGIAAALRTACRPAWSQAEAHEDRETAIAWRPPIAGGRAALQP